MHAVPRHLFVPPVAWVDPYDGPAYLVDRDHDQQRWMDAAYANAAIIVQKDDGATPLAEEGRYTSSLSSPDVVFAFLDLLDPYEADEILEIGTGTGWTAGLLAHRVGEQNVISIEVDAALAEQAAVTLANAGVIPKLVTGDGAEIRPEGGPFDRVHVTCGVATVPYGWVEQIRPGGVIVFPWMSGWEPGHKARLTVMPDGRAVGRFAHGGCGYMMLRSQRPANTDEPPGDPRESATMTDPRRLCRDSYAADVAIAGQCPDVRSAPKHHDDGTFELYLHAGDSAAQVIYSPLYKASTVRQYGSRNLWDEVEAAFFRWVSWGEPGRDRFGMTVAPEGQQIWLDSPNNVL
ncbi:protein-L-isoaspartate(D-aspartate) O-methyltransferase [Actinomadura craniellae]|uniref:Protein-L-isoaspartate O-methyltransferase n=2 Tax=Actinomadura craniellae TaxID=2231787 RepID=A0A365H7B7_9ACTN|nr:protein-L-isoaspartate(D-aspartate) O-methyltransferase [Actinomadura craniellae]